MFERGAGILCKSELPPAQDHQNAYEYNSPCHHTCWSHRPHLPSFPLHSSRSHLWTCAYMRVHKGSTTILLVLQAKKMTKRQTNKIQIQCSLFAITGKLKILKTAFFFCFLVFLWYTIIHVQAAKYKHWVGTCLVVLFLFYCCTTFCPLICMTNWMTTFPPIVHCWKSSARKEVPSGSLYRIPELVQVNRLAVYRIKSIHGKVLALTMHTNAT